MACLSMATELGVDQPGDFAVEPGAVTMRLGEPLGFDTPTPQDV
jgi:hypothetical protein